MTLPAPEWSYYEVNISFRGDHLFATAPRSCINHHQLCRVVTLFAKKFPASDGYEMTVTRREATGHHVPLEAALQEHAP